jgi:hypothetical protein
MGRGFHLTIDEWFYHWFANSERFSEAAKFFLHIFEVCDVIVLRKDTPLARKFYQLDEESGKWPINQRDAVRLIKNLFLSNSNKIYWVENVQAFSKEIKQSLPRKDVYLVEICFQTQEKILITSDKTLYQSVLDLQQKLAISPFLVEGFIPKYLNDEI